MATRINYHAAFATSEDHEHPAKELDQQGPHTRGWKSRQFCIYPQELAFKLASRTHVSKIQVLVHQLLIPEKIEFHIGDVERGKDETYANAKFALLGSVGLSTNEESLHKAREVKAVAVDCEGLFVKLVIHRNHLNKSNRFNQVSIMGINLLGAEKEANNNTVGKTAVGEPDPSLPSYEDLAFNMYVDHDCVKYMQKLEARKAIAVKNERFEYAKNCRDAVGLLHKAGLRLGKYHIEKRMAIEEENYDRAKLKKDHTEGYKEAVMDSLRIDQLLESDGIDPKNNKTLNLELPLPPGRRRRSPTPPPEPSPPPRPKSDPLPPIPRTPETRQDSSHSVKKPMTPPPPIYNPTAPQTPQSPSASAPVPAPVPVPRGLSPPPPPSYRPASQASSPLPPRRRSPRPQQPPISRRKLMAGMLVGDVGGSSGSDPRQMSSVLTDQDRKAAALPIEVFGEAMVESFYTKSFLQKEEGFRNLMSSLRSDDNVKADKKTRAATFLLLRGLKDKMYTVCQQAVEALGYLTGPFANKHKTSKRELSNTLEATVPELIQKLGENATRVQTMASESLLLLADMANRRHLPEVADALAAPLKGAVPARLALARLDTLEKIVVKHGVSEDGPQFTSHVAEFAVSALEQPVDQVRAAGTRLLVLIYPEDKRLVRNMLPSSDKNKNSSYRSLLAELDRLDGKRGPAVASLRLDSPAELRAVREEKEPRWREEPDEEDKETEEEEKETEQRSRPPTIAEDPQLSRALRSKSMAPNIGTDAAERGRDDDDRTCVFCGVTDDRFETEEGMEYHFWKSCPMLTRCKDCKQAVEVSNYTEHQLRDCREHKNYKCCKRCQEAVSKADYDYHVRSYQCMPAKSGPAGNHCPLCHQNTPPYETGWRQHLLEDCTANSRNPRGLARTGRRVSMTPPATVAGRATVADRTLRSRPGRIQSELRSRRRGSLSGPLAPTPQPPPGPPRANSDLGPRRTPPAGRERRTPPGGRERRTPPGGRERRTPPGGRERRTPPGGRQGNISQRGRQDRTLAGGRQGKTPPGRGQPSRAPPAAKTPAKRALPGKIQSTRTPPGGRQPTKTPPGKSKTPPSRDRAKPAGKQTPRGAGAGGRRHSLPGAQGRERQQNRDVVKKPPARDGASRGREPSNAARTSKMEVPRDRRARSHSVSRIPRSRR